MRSLGKGLGRLLLLVGILAAAVWLLPREGAEPSRDFAAQSTADPALLPAREAQIADLVPGTEARVIWAGAEGVPTQLSVLYLHGFSASSEEIRPVPDRVAEALGANLVYARLPGHGRSPEALAEVRAGDWLDETDLMLDIARAVGDRVLVIATSTGGTLAAYAATEPAMADRVAGIVFVSPNFALADRFGFLIEWPFARVWAPLLLGRDRGFEPLNDQQATFWTERYPTGAVAALGAIMRDTRARDIEGAAIPALFVFSDADQVVSASATRAISARWGGPVTLRPQDLPSEGADPDAHVIAGDIVSPAMTGPVIDLILEWAAALPG